MPALRIDLRDKLIALVAALPGYTTDNVVPYKLDKVEGAAAQASVYLDDLSSSPVAMRGQRQRSQSVTVSLFGTDAIDAEAALSGQLNTLEKAVEAARLEGEFGTITTVYLSAATVAHDATSKGRIADLHATFTFEFTESLS
jgi:hypothetical protein